SHTSAPSRGDLVAYQPEPARAAWLEAQGYTGRGWPLIKPVAGLEGDEVCRTGNRIMINGVWVAEALAADSGGRALPAWHGCTSLGPGDLFLLADEPRSVDGRYFGVGDSGRILGSATLIWPPAPSPPEQHPDVGGALSTRTHVADTLSDGR
ncbi:MAG: S26 family signal peptidase, partial [Hyphomonas sp.]|nr:S26 family signal peptidase [Hyphomonas sp.]